MKRFINKVSIAFAFCAALGSCVEQMPDVNETLVLGRCLSPTEATAPVDRADGKTVAFTWSESKGATQYTIEIFEGAEDADPAVVFEGTPLYTETPKSSPFKKELPSDKFYFARVKAQAPDSGVEDSKWVEFPYPIGTYEVKSNLWPTVALRTSSSLTIEWKEVDADRIDHVRVTPNPEDESKAYKRYDVAASEGETVQTVIDGLNPSVKYTLAVHFKSANRGEVVAWTRPSLDNPTEVSTTEQLVQALNDGAKTILLAYSETSYDIAKTVKMPASADGISLYGNSTEAGQMPVISGELWIPDGLKKLHIEGISFDGDSYTYTHPLVFNADADDPMDEISVVNCSITGYKAGFFLNDNGKADVAKIVFNSIMVSDILGDGGNGFDIRQQVNIGSIEISESTFTDGFRSFFRIDKATVSEFIFKNNTLNNMCYVENGNNKGLFYIGAGKGQVVIPKFEMTDNLFLNMNGNKDRTLLFSDEVGVPTKMANNWYYKLGAGFWKPETINDDKINSDGKGKLTQTAGLAGGGQILSSDPCYDSAEGNLYVKNAAALEAKVGDPRWLQTYKPVVEDLTLTPAAAGKSWNLMDTKTFGKTVKTSCVRDGLRFFVSANPFKVSEKGLEFAAAGTVEALGVPSDAAIAFMVDTPGTVILSSIKSNTGSPNGHITVAVGPADGSGAKVEGSVNVGTAKAKVALPNIVAGEPQIVYLYGCSSVILTALQWTDQVASGATPVLSTPTVTISQESADDEFTGEVKLSWDEVSAAGSYKIYMNIPVDEEEPEAYAEVTATEYVLPLSKIGTGKFTFSVQACPASDDMSREPSELSAAVAFKYLETLKPISVETYWGHDYFRSLGTELGTGDIDKTTNGYSETAMVIDNLSFIFGGGKFKFGENDITVDDVKSKVWRVQLGGTGTPGEKACIQFKVAGPGTVVVEAIASGDETTNNRVLAVALNGTEKSTLPLSLTRTKSPEVLTVDCADAVSGDVINIFSKNKGINIFSIKWVPAPSDNPSVDYVWDFSASEWVDAMNGSGIAANTNDNNWNLEVDGLKVVSGDSSIKWNFSGETYFWQPGGPGSDTKRYFEFTTEVAGKLTVYASNTGSSEDLTRMVTVKVGDGAEQSLQGGYSSSAGAKPCEFDISAGIVKIYPTGNGLRFYKIEFHSN